MRKVVISDATKEFFTKTKVKVFIYPKFESKNVIWVIERFMPFRVLYSQMMH